MIPIYLPWDYMDNNKKYTMTPKYVIDTLWGEEDIL